MSAVVEFVIAELRKRNWSIREFARRSGGAPTQVSRILRGQARVSADFCLDVARTLDEPPGRILRLGGFLPPPPDNSLLGLVQMMMDRTGPEFDYAVRVLFYGLGLEPCESIKPKVGVLEGPDIPSPTHEYQVPDISLDERGMRKLGELWNQSSPYERTMLTEHLQRLAEHYSENSGASVDEQIVQIDIQGREEPTRYLVAAMAFKQLSLQIWGNEMNKFFHIEACFSSPSVLMCRFCPYQKHCMLFEMDWSHRHAELKVG